VLNEVRPVSAIGLTRVADSVEIALALLAWVNVFVGLLNVVPLYPLDGGHFAVALYEKVRGRPADVRKMVPVAAAVFAFIVLLGILGIYFDIVSPLELPG
jgi:membrane-associated protease RseP (regulator of RpoE activity)